MLDQLLKVLTPDLVIQAVKSNPQAVMDTLQKFDTFRLLGESLSTDLQIVLSNNSKYLNDYLRSEEGKIATKTWVQSFADFVIVIENKANAVEEAKLLPSSATILETKIRAELEVKIRKEIEEAIQQEIVKAKELKVVSATLSKK